MGITLVRLNLSQIVTLWYGYMSRDSLYCGAVRGLPYSGTGLHSCAASRTASRTRSVDIRNTASTPVLVLTIRITVSCTLVLDYRTRAAGSGIRDGTAAGGASSCIASAKVNRSDPASPS